MPTTWVEGYHYEVPPGSLVLGHPTDNAMVMWIDVLAVTSPPVNLTVPLVTQAGAILNCTMGTWEGEPTSYAYQWQIDGVDDGINAPNYATVAGDAGKTATCVVTATNAHGSTAAPPSNALVIE